MVEEKKHLTEADIREKFLKYKRFSIDQLNPELLTRRDLSFVEEVLNSYNKKNPSSINNKSSNINNSSLNNKGKNANSYCSSINVNPQKNSKVIVKKEEKKEKEEKVYEVVNSEINSNLMRLVSSSSDKQRTDLIESNNPSKQVHSLTPEFNKNPNISKADFFIDTLCSDNIKSVKINPQAVKPETKTVIGPNVTTIKNDFKKIKNIKSTTSSNITITSATTTWNGKKIIDDLDESIVNHGTENNLISSKNIGLNTVDFIDIVDKKELITVNDKSDSKDILGRKEIKLIKKNDLNKRKDQVKSIKIQIPRDEIKIENPEIPVLDKPCVSIEKFTYNKIISDNTEFKLEEDKIKVDKAEIASENLNLEESIKSPFNNVIKKDNSIIDEKEVDDNIHVKKTDMSSLLRDFENNTPLKKKENSLIVISEIEGHLIQIKKEIKKILEKISNKPGILCEIDNKFDQLEIYSKIECQDSKIYTWERIPKILIKVIDIAIIVEEKTEKEFQFQIIDESKDKNKTNRDWLKKILNYLKYNIKIKIFKNKKTHNMLAEFHSSLGNTIDKVDISESRKDTRDIVKFSHRLSKFIDINEKIIQLIKSSKLIKEKCDFEEIINILKMNYNYLSLKLINKVATFAIDMILNSTE